VSSDIYLGAAAPTDAERTAIDAFVSSVLPANGHGRTEAVEGRVQRGGRKTRLLRTYLLPALHVLQGRFGWISEGALNHVCERLGVPPAEAYGVASFYAMFRTKPAPPTIVHVCDDLACRVNGAGSLIEQVESAMGPAGSASTRATWMRSPCLGMCEQAPAVLAQRAGFPDVSLGGATLGTVNAVAAEGADIACTGADTAPQTWRPAARRTLRLLSRVGLVDPTSIDDYRALGGYAALRRAVQLGPGATIREVTDARLLGRGGAAFPAGAKWKAVAEQSERPHHVVCNADESEPGTFKDRLLMELDPFAVLEALTIAGFATGAERGFLYLRGEYPLALERLEHAIVDARRHGMLGDDVGGHGFRFDIELRRGAGAYICGEETALFESIEGKRGEPRNKPPFPVTFGLFGKPTSINNVETLLNVLPIMTLGAAMYARIGTEGSTGPRLFCLSGHVERPGVYEVPHGVTLGELLELAGGVRERRALKAVLLGGAAGGFLGPDRLDARLTFEDAREGGYTLGSGVVMVFDETVDLVDTCLRIARFFRDESCGQCVPCRVGTVRQEEALHRLVLGRTIGGTADELALLQDVAQVMRDASICGLGQTAANAVQSAISTFGLFEGGSA
jgi:NADH-quinone oxidoreductase subunit F